MRGTSGGFDCSRSTEYTSYHSALLLCVDKAVRHLPHVYRRCLVNICAINTTQGLLLTSERDPQDVALRPTRLHFVSLRPVARKGPALPYPTLPGPALTQPDGKLNTKPKSVFSACRRSHSDAQGVKREQRKPRRTTLLKTANLKSRFAPKPPPFARDPLSPLRFVH